MKKIVALLIALVMMISVCACTQNAEPANTDEPANTTPAQTTEPTAEPTTAEPTAEPANQHFDKLTLEFVPSKDADVIIAGTQNLPELVKAEMAKLGYDIDEVDITVGTSYDATGEAMSAGSIDLGWLPGGTYALYSDDTDVILTATRNGLSNDSTNPADWNGEANATKKDGPQVTYYRSLIYAAPTEYGKKLAEKVNNGEALTWEDLDGARWAVQKTSSSAGYIYPSMWLMANYDGKKISDLSNVIPLDSGYGTAFSYAAAEQVDIIVCYADGRNDYEASWMLPVDQKDETGKQGMGRSESIWNELNVIGVTDGIYNDTVAVSKASPYYTPELVAALQDCFINIINTPEGQEIFSVYSHTGYAKAVDSDYDGARAALKAVSD
ncbi:MAG: PhnD/SsuA/transferrin family substrate-binding protein [Christensenellaceae bacterium]|nr:PhnD/SsuA/transferrin family substrate-binding protein [Christensenellaceae bacterium]